MADGEEGAGGGLLQAGLALDGVMVDFVVGGLVVVVADAGGAADAEPGAEQFLVDEPRDVGVVGHEAGDAAVHLVEDPSEFGLGGAALARLDPAVGLHELEQLGVPTVDDHGDQAGDRVVREGRFAGVERLLPCIGDDLVFDVPDEAEPVLGRTGFVEDPGEGPNRLGQEGVLDALAEALAECSLECHVVQLPGEHRDGSERGEIREPEDVHDEFRGEIDLVRGDDGDDSPRCISAASAFVRSLGNDDLDLSRRSR